MEENKKHFTREDINKQAFLVKSNISATKVRTDISGNDHETLLNSFLTLKGMFNDFIDKNNIENTNCLQEQKTTVHTVQIDYKCPKCDNGFLRPTGIVYASNPPLFPHKCNSCEHGETFSKSYPYIEITKSSTNINIDKKPKLFVFEEFVWHHHG